MIKVSPRSVQVLIICNMRQHANTELLLILSPPVRNACWARIQRVFYFLFIIMLIQQPLPSRDKDPIHSFLPAVFPRNATLVHLNTKPFIPHPSHLLPSGATTKQLTESLARPTFAVFPLQKVCTST